MRRLREMVDQFTFGKPRDVLVPAVWLFVAELVNCIPAGIVFMAIYVLGGAFFPPYALDTGALVGLAVAAACLLLVQYAFEISSYWFTYIRAYRDSAAKRTAYVEKLRAVPLGFFSSKRSGDLISSFADDFANVEYTMCYWLPYPLGVAALLALCLAFLLAFDWRMAVATFALLPASMLLTFLAGRRKRASKQEVLDAKARAAGQLNEYLRGMKDLKAYRRTGSGFAALADAYGDLRRACVRDELVVGNLSTLASQLVRFTVPVVATVGAYLLVGGSLSVLDYIACAVVATKLSAPMAMVAQSLSALQDMAASGARLAAVMGEPDQGGSREAGTVEGLAFEGVGFGYRPGEPVLHGVDLQVAPHRLTALVGPSGSGKSTCMRLMARFWDADEGCVRAVGGHAGDEDPVERARGEGQAGRAGGEVPTGHAGDGALAGCGTGTDLRELAPHGLLANVSMVMQSAYLFRGTIRENLCFGRDIPQERLEAACRDASCHEFIARLPEGYDTLVGEGGATLSGGERQRLSLARALLKDAPILLLDEPTASLDADNEALVQQALDRIARDRTVVMIAHRLKTVRGADQVVVLEHGSVTERGTHDELLERGGTYARLWSLQTAARDYVFQR